jgi:hypothetical protein
MDRLLNDQPNYLAPALLLAAVSAVGLILFWRRYADDSPLPEQRTVLTLILVGLPLIGLAGAAGAYAGYPMGVYRFNYFAAPAQVLVLVGGLSWISHHLTRTLRLHPVYLLTGFAVIYSVIAGHWYYQAQRYGEQNNAESRSFAQNLDFLRDLVALVPQAQAHTLLLYSCEDKAVAYNWQFVDELAGLYLYDEVRINAIDSVHFEPDRVTYRFPLAFFNFEPITYGYDELVIVGCSDSGMRVLDAVPDHRNIPDNAAADRYAPYSRIEQAFPDEKIRRLLGL